MAQSIQSLIAATVNGVIRRLFPDDYSSLCHVHAIVGANLISIVLNRVYRPVAGLAVIDCGKGNFIRLLDNAAFANPAGGAFHCWIESAEVVIREKEVVDLTFRHNKDYAAKNGFAWRRPDPPEFLWGPWSRVVIRADLARLPPSFAEGKVWLHETDEGWDWMTHHLAENMNAYVTLTAEALKELQAALPPGSSLLAPLLPPKPAGDSAAVRTGSAPASVPSPA